MCLLHMCCTCIYRSSSDRRSHQGILAPDKEQVCPYSSVNQDMKDFSDTRSSLSGAKSMYFIHPDRYTRLEDTPTFPSSSAWTSVSRNQPCLAQSMFNLSAAAAASSSTSSTLPVDHKERMELIKQDLQRFSRRECVEKSSKEPRSEGASEELGSIPRVSSRWSQFMCEEDSNSEEEEEEEGRNGRKDGRQQTTSTHILASKSSIAKYTLTGHT